MAEIPSIFYYTIGFLIFSNFAAIITLLTFIFKAGMFVSETRAGIKSAKATGDRVHKRLDDHLENHP